MHRRSHGFTLLEMIVVLAIAALIIGIGAGAVYTLAEDHELRRVVHEAEITCMQAMTNTLDSDHGITVDFEKLPMASNLRVRRAGTKDFVPAKEQQLRLRPGGLCEPLTLRWQKDSAWIRATLDPLTGSFIDVEEHL